MNSKRKPRLPWLIGATIFIAILFIFIIIFWGKLIDLFFASGKDDPSGELLKTVLTALAGIGVFFTYWTSIRRAEAAEKTANAQFQQTFIERFNRAVEQLSHGQASVRMGGIYTLHSLAKESIDTKLQETICNIFCLFIKEQSQKLIRLDETEDPEFHKEIVAPVSIDIQAVCDILFKRDTFSTYSGFHKILSGIKLKELSLIDCHLQNVDLNDSDLGNSKFIHVEMARVYLNRSHLEESIFRFASLKHVQLTDAYLDRADFKNANLKRVDLSNAYLKESILLTTNLEEAILTGANLNETILDGTNFTGASLDHVSIQGASGLKIDQLLSTKTIFKMTGLPEEIRSEIYKLKPELLEDPDK